MLDDLQFITFETDDLARVVREQANLSHPEVYEDLRSEAIVTQVYGKSELFIGLDGIQSLLLKLVGMDIYSDAYGGRLTDEFVQAVPADAVDVRRLRKTRRPARS